jgi:hypothetical protein
MVVGVIQPSIDSAEYALSGSFHAWHYKPSRAYGFEGVEQWLCGGRHVLMMDDMSEMTISCVRILNVVGTGMSGRHWNVKNAGVVSRAAYRILNMSSAAFSIWIGKCWIHPSSFGGDG